MALNAAQMSAFFEQQANLASRGLERAIETKNRRLASLNCRQGVKSFTMAGLIQWRQGIDASNAFKRAIDFQNIAATAMTDLNDCPRERVGFLAFLIDLPHDQVETASLQSDRLLDSILCNSLHHEVNFAEWERGIIGLGKHGSSLAVATYDGYRQLMQVPEHERSSVFAQVANFFEQRKRDGYFSGSDQTEGGGLDNEFTVDYRLGAIAKKLGLNVDSIHSWRWR